MNFVDAMTLLRKRPPNTVEIERPGGVRLRRVGPVAFTIVDGNVSAEFVPTKDDRSARDWIEVVGG